MLEEIFQKIKRLCLSLKTWYLTRSPAFRAALCVWAVHAVALPCYLGTGMLAMVIIYPLKIFIIFPALGFFAAKFAYQQDAYKKFYIREAARAAVFSWLFAAVIYFFVTLVLGLLTFGLSLLLYCIFLPIDLIVEISCAIVGAWIFKFLTSTTINTDAV